MGTIDDQYEHLLSPLQDTSARRNVHFDKDNKGAPIEGLPLEDTNEERRRRTE